MLEVGSPCNLALGFPPTCLLDHVNSSCQIKTTWICRWCEQSWNAHSWCEPNWTALIAAWEALWDPLFPNFANSLGGFVRSSFFPFSKYLFSSCRCPTFYSSRMSPVTLLPLANQSTFPSCETFCNINLFPPPISDRQLACSLQFLFFLLPDLWPFASCSWRPLLTYFFAHHIVPSAAKAALYNVLESPALQRAKGVVDMVASLKTVTAVVVPDKWVRYYS